VVLKTSAVAALLIGWSMVGAPEGAAQEVQVPLDRDGKVQVITADLERKLRLFTDYQAFREARLFQLADSSFVLEITHEPAGRFTRVRVPLTPAAAQEFRRRVSDGLTTVAPEAVLDQSGRTKLLVWSTLLSLGFYGPAAPIVLDVDDPQGAVGLYMLSAGAGFFVPFVATRHIPVTEAAAVLSTYGATRGIIHGTLGAYLFRNDPSDRAFFAGGVVGGLTEGIIGFAVANAGRLSSGSAELTGVGSDVGLGTGFAVSHLAGFLDSSYDPATGIFHEERRAATVAIALSSAAGGAALGYALSRTEPYTRGDAFLFRNAGILGAHVGLAVADALNPNGDRDKLYSGLALTGGALGLIAGQRLVRGRDFTTAQGTFGTLGQVAGGLVGLGLGYLVSSENGDNSTILLAGSALGAGVGYAVMYSSFAKQAKVGLLPEGLDLSFDPLALARRDGASPAIRANYRF
jgi:hypothetical protein